MEADGEEKSMHVHLLLFPHPRLPPLSEEYRTAPVVVSMHEPQSPDDKPVSRYASPLAFLKAISDSHH